MQEYRLLLIKIGGGVITDKKVRYGLKQEVLTRLCKEMAEGIGGLKNTDVIIGNGAGSFAHFSATKYVTAKGFKDERGRLGAGWVRHDAAKLNQIVFEELLKVGVTAFSFSPSSMIAVADGEVRAVWLEPLKDALGNGLTPLVYGDVMVDSKRGSGIFSTEKVFDVLAIELRQSYQKLKVIHVSSEEGVMVGGSVYPEITKNNFDQIKSSLTGSGGVDVTGGMLHKVEECLKVAEMGVESWIVSGVVPGRVREAIVGKRIMGTKIC